MPRRKKTISKSLSLDYNVVKEKLPIITVICYAVFVVGVAIGLFGRSVAATSALAFLGSIAQISATILSIFSSGFLFLLGLSSKKIRQNFSKGDFIAAFALFTVTIIHCLVSILVIEPDKPIDLGTTAGFILVVMPLWWMTGAIMIIAVFIWGLYTEKT